MIDIALHGGKGISQLRDIAQRQAISAKYLDHILSSLRKAGLIVSSRDRQYGYRLARPASQITIRDIVQVLEGSLAPVECIENPKCCAQIQACPSRDIWRKLKVEMEKVLDSITLQELIDSNNTEQSTQLNFCI
jgi:Rrf2 family protein